MTSIKVSVKNALDYRQLGELPLLYSLRLVNLRLPIVHPDLFGALTVLKMLSLAQNCLVSLPDNFGSMRNLENANIAQVGLKQRGVVCVGMGAGVNLEMVHLTLRHCVGTDASGVACCRIN